MGYEGSLPSGFLYIKRVYLSFYLAVRRARSFQDLQVILHSSFAQAMFCIQAVACTILEETSRPTLLLIPLTKGITR